MKLALMPGETVPRSELTELGFFAMQMFWGHGPDGDKDDPTAEAIDALLEEGQIALAAMTLHVDLVGPQGEIAGDVDRLIRCVEKTAALEGRFGENERPILVGIPLDIQRERTSTTGPCLRGCVAGLPEPACAHKSWAYILRSKLRALAAWGARRPTCTLRIACLLRP